MAPTKRQIITSLSVVYLAALTILGAFALHSAHVYSLPIPDIMCGLTLALPPLAGIALETVVSLNDRFVSRNKQPQTSRFLQSSVIVAFIVFEAVLATLAGTHIAPPGSLNCALSERWEAMFRSKDGEGILRIQDAFNCCGLRSPRDMAYPFPDKQHGAETCMVRYERDTACLEPWRGEERKVAIMLLVVPLLVFVWKVAILLAPTSSTSSFLPSAIRLPADSSSSSPSSPNNTRPRQAIEYRASRDSHDNTAQPALTPSEADSVAEEVERLNKDSNLASHVEGGRSKPNGHNGLWRDRGQEVWREGGSGDAA